MICPNCGYENQEGAKFCGKCGWKLTDPAKDAKPAEEPMPAREPKLAEEANLAEKTKPAAVPAEEPKPAPVPAIKQKSAPAPAETKEEPISISAHSAKLDEPAPKKRNSKLGKAVFPVLAAAGLAAGFFCGRSLAPEENPIARELHYDTYTLSMAAGFTYDGISDKGTVEILGPQGTPLCQITDVQDGCYRILDKVSKIIYLDAESQLCEQQLPKGEKNVLTKKGNWDTVWVSEDGGYMTYAEQVNDLTETMIYDLAGGKPKRLTDGIVKDQYLDTNDKSLYYLDESGALYQSKNLSDKNRIKGDVTGYQLLSSEPAVFWQSQSDEETAFGIKWGEEENRLNGFRSITNVAIEDDSQLILVQGCEEDESSDSLYFMAKNQEPVEAYSDVAEFFCADNLNLLYYRTTDGILYRVSLPVSKLGDATDSSGMKAAVKSMEKQKLSSDARMMAVSKNGEHVIWISSEGELHYLHFQSEKDLVLGEHVKEARAFDQSIYAVREDGRMIRCVYPNGEAVNVKNIQEDSAGTVQVSTPYGDSLATADEETGTLQVLDRENGRTTLIPDITVYDKVMVQGQRIYGKNMDYSQVQGARRLTSENLDILLTLKDDKHVTVYEIPDLSGIVYRDGEEHTAVLHPAGVTKFQLELGAEENITVGSDWDILTNDTFITLGEGSSFYWNTGTGENALLMLPMAEGQITTLKRNVELALNYEAEAEERSQYITAERERIEEERRREEERRQQAEQQARNTLLSRAQNYYYNDVYMQSGSYYYSSPSLSRRTNTYVTSTVKKYVYDYQVDYSNSIIWLKVKNANNDYRWIYMR